jgi:hypothetical protein
VIAEEQRAVMSRQRNPGVSRENRISGDGLLRLEKQLQSGARISAMVLRQWIKRYGEPARELMARYDCLPEDE